MVQVEKIFCSMMLIGIICLTAYSIASNKNASIIALKKDKLVQQIEAIQENFYFSDENSMAYKAQLISQLIEKYQPNVSSNVPDEILIKPQ